jgi:hypothetical protein
MGVKLNLTLREVHRLKMLRMFGPSKGEVTEGWRGLLNDQVKEVKMEKACSMNREMITDTKLVGKPQGKRPLGRPRRRWVDNIKMDFGEIRCGGMDLLDLAQNRDQLLCTR